MSITEELREFIETHLYLGATALGGWKEAAFAIADRIDAEHKKACDDAWDNGYEADYLGIEKWLTEHPQVMEHHGWVRMPKDADGEYIHIGDVMEGVDKYDSLKKVKGKVITVSFESDGAVDVAVQAWSSDGRSWHRAYLDPDASVYRHYHVPTVEDVLREFAEGLGVPVADSYIAASAAKLRLAGES